MQGTPIVIVVNNGKGGVGKSTTSFHLTSPLIQAGYRVLCCDMDLQANLTNAFLGKDGTEQLPYQRTSVALFDRASVPTAADLIHSTNLDGVSLIPAHPLLMAVDSTNPDCPAFFASLLPSLEEFPETIVSLYNTSPETFSEYKYALRLFLEEVRCDYDIILIDCRPDFNMMTWNALFAGEFILCPINPEDYGAQGISLVHAANAAVGRKGNDKLQLLGYVINEMQQTTNLHSRYEPVIRKEYGPDVFNTVIPRTIALPAAIPKGQPITVCEPTSRAATRFNDLAKELLERVERLRCEPRRLISSSESHFQKAI